MKLPDELSALSRHLMLFLIAIFAFTSKTILESNFIYVRILYTISICLAFFSFLAGYSTLFSIFNDQYAQMERDPLLADKAQAPRSAITRTQIHYALTISALFFLMGSILVSLWSA